VLHVSLANVASLDAEGGEPMAGIGGVPQKGTEEFPVRPKILEFQVDDGAQSK